VVDWGGTSVTAQKVGPLIRSEKARCPSESDQEDHAPTKTHSPKRRRLLGRTLVPCGKREKKLTPLSSRIKGVIVPQRPTALRVDNTKRLAKAEKIRRSHTGAFGDSAFGDNVLCTSLRVGSVRKEDLECSGTAEHTQKKKTRRSSIHE